MTPNVWKMFTNPPSTLTFCPYLSWLNNLFMPNFQHTRMSSYAKNKLQMCWVTQHQCIRCQMCGNVDTLIHYIHFGLLQKMTGHHLTIYSWQSSNSWGCPLMLKTNYRCVQSLNISVDVAKCVKMFTNSPSSLTFVGYKKRLVLIEQSNHGKVST